jgi:hypothetical protein
MLKNVDEKMKLVINKNSIRKVHVISLFDSIVFKQDRPFVICDIDETLLYLDSNVGYNVHFPLFYNKHSSLLNGSNYTVGPLVRSIFPTDISGFQRLEHRISSLGGKLIFLTARSSNGYKYVVEDFLKIGLDASNYEIHYTGNVITKGQYIRDRIDVSGYNDLYFIDDLQDNIVSVCHCFPQAHLYLFRRFPL